MLYSGYKRQIHNNEESLRANLSKIELLNKDIAKTEILNTIIKENNSEHFQENTTLMIMKMFIQKILLFLKMIPAI